MNLEKIMLSERGQAPKGLLLYDRNTQNRQIHRCRKQTSGCEGIEEEEQGVTADRCVASWNHGNWRGLESSDACITL
jgi:hypothetical protein